MRETMNGDVHRFRLDSPPPNGRKYGEAEMMPPSMGSAGSGLASTRSGLSTNPSIRTNESSIDRSSADSFDAHPRSLLDEAARREQKREKKEKKSKDKKEKKNKKEKKHKMEKKRSKSERISEDSAASYDSDAQRVTPLEEPPTSRRLSSQTEHTSPMSPSPNGTKKKYLSNELEARGVKLRGEPELDKMLQVAMEMSLKDFRQSRRNLMSEPRGREKSLSTCVPLQSIPLPDAHVDQDDCNVQDGRPGHERQGSHRSLFSQANEMTEVVVEDPRGKIKAQRRFSTRNLIPPSKSLSESHINDHEPKLPTRTSIEYPDNDPKSRFFDDDPKAQHFDQEQAPGRRPDDPNDPLSHWTESDVRKKFFDEEFDEDLFSQVPRRPTQRSNRRASTGATATPDDQIRPIDQIRLARQNLSAQEAEEIERALREAGDNTDEQITRRGPVRGSAAQKPRQRESSPPSLPNVPDVNASEHLSPEEAAEIARALQEADDEEARKSFQLALQLQSQEATLFTSQRQRNARQAPQAREGNYDEQAAGAVRSNRDGGADAGYRVNAARPAQNGDRVRNHVVGPNNEAPRRSGVDDDDAYNSFRQSMQRQKGVTGSGRAASDTNSGVMDQRVRMLITRAINNRLIEKCNGIVREGKEAVIYHADQSEVGGGYDVAIKVFTHIEDVQGRNDYVDGDPRFDGKFRNASSRDKLEMWAEKEYRNLLRANRSGVPVPTPLIQKENVVFMRFLGEDGWAVPQLKDLQIRKGSDKWTTLYSQIMVAIRR
jgi:hypothetical protein